MPIRKKKKKGREIRTALDITLNNSTFERTSLIFISSRSLDWTPQKVFEYSQNSEFILRQGKEKREVATDIGLLYPLRVLRDIIHKESGLGSAQDMKSVTPLLFQNFFRSESAAKG